MWVFANMSVPIIVPIQGLGQCPLDVFVDPVHTLWARPGPGFIYYLTPMHAPCLTEGRDNTLSLLYLVLNNLWNVWVFPFPWYTATWVNGHWSLWGWSERFMTVCLLWCCRIFPSRIWPLLQYIVLSPKLTQAQKLDKVSWLLLGQLSLASDHRWFLLMVQVEVYLESS